MPQAKQPAAQQGQVQGETIAQASDRARADDAASQERDTSQETQQGSSGGLSDEDKAQAQSVRISSYESELREAHAHPVVDDDGVVTNVRDIQSDYTDEQEERFRQRQS